MEVQKWQKGKPRKRQRKKKQQRRKERRKNKHLRSLCCRIAINAYALVAFLLTTAGDIQIFDCFGGCLIVYQSFQPLKYGGSVTLSGVLSELLFQCFCIMNCVCVDVIVEISENSLFAFEVILYPLCPALQSGF